MTASAIIESATAEGVMVSLSPAGKIKVTGGRAALDRWQPLLKQYKAGIIELLSGEPGGVVERPPLPHWCSSDCHHLRRLELDNLPPVTACYRWQSPTNWTWERLDRLDACPLTTESAPPPMPPSPMPPTTGPEVIGLRLRRPPRSE